MRNPAALDGDDGSSTVEFTLVGALLTVLTLAVIQLGLAVYVRNVVHDAAVEGAHVAALADGEWGAGVARARDLVTRAVGAEYASDIEATSEGGTVVVVTVRAPLPLVGLWGISGALEVTGRAPVESFG